jgi:hypothetical protein
LKVSSRFLRVDSESNRNRRRQGRRRQSSSAGGLNLERLEDRLYLTAGNGLQGQYFDSPDLSTSVIVRIDSQVDFNWGTGSPAAAIPTDQFSVRWTGQLESRFTESHSFIVNSDDGLRLWVNGQLLIDAWEASSTVDAAADLDLIAGRKYDIQLEYRESIGVANVTLEWSSPSLAREIIPQSQLYAGDRGGLLVETWEGISGSSISDLVADPSFPSNPDAVTSIGSFETLSNTGDEFGRRIRGHLHVPETGPYTFFIVGDESAQLWFSQSSDPDGKRLIASVESATGARQWDADSSQQSIVFYLVAGQEYYIEALQKEANGGDHLAVGWLKPDSLQIEVIPGEHLTPVKPTVSIFSDRPNVSEAATQPGRFKIIRSGTP